jgi:hypothetical protein
MVFSLQIAHIISEIPSQMAQTLIGYGFSHYKLHIISCFLPLQSGHFFAEWAFFWAM